MPTTAKFYSGLQISQSTILDLGTAAFEVAPDLTPTEYANGTASGQISKVFTDTRTLAASATENLDLAAVLTDAFGAVLTFAVVKAIEIRAAAANTNDVVVGGGTNPFLGWFSDPTDKIKIPPGGKFAICHPGAGWTVTAGTGDILLVANSAGGTGVTYNIKIVG